MYKKEPIVFDTFGPIHRFFQTHPLTGYLPTVTKDIFALAFCLLKFKSETNLFKKMVLFI